MISSPFTLPEVVHKCWFTSSCIWTSYFKKIKQNILCPFCTSHPPNTRIQDENGVEEAWESILFKKKIKEPLDFKVFGYVSMLIFIASSVLMQYKLYFAVLDALE